jgi:hypothetical protein
VECTIDNAFSLRDSIINCTLHLSKDQPEDGPTNWAETCRWNYNLIYQNTKLFLTVLYIYIYIYNYILAYIQHNGDV